MKYRELGASGLLVSPICLGTMTFGTPVAKEAAVRLVHGAIDLGINFIDTANVYEGYDRVLGSAGGVAEEITGQAIQGKRDKVVLATKVGAPIGPGPQDRGLSASHIERAVDDSLRRLNTDYIDLYIIHWPDKHTPLETTLASIDRVARQGKVRCFGASNHSAAELCEMLWLADKHQMPRVVSSQIPYSLLRREFQHDLTFCDKHQIGVTPYQSLQGGLLTGKYQRGHEPPADSRAAEKPEWLWQADDALFGRLEQIESLANELNTSMTTFSLAAALAQPAMSSLVVGSKSVEQISQTLEALELQIPEDILTRLDECCPPPWQQPDPIRR